MNRAVAIVIAFVFLALRIALLKAREPFFDELFTVWISGKSFAGIVNALMNDSGPPLYYFVVHALGLHSVFADRVLVLVFPLLLRRPRAFIAAFIAFAPGFWLAFHQPAAATAWIGRWPSWPDALFARPPLGLALLALVLAIAAAIPWNRFTTMAAIPI